MLSSLTVCDCGRSLTIEYGTVGTLRPIPMLYCLACNRPIPAETDICACGNASTARRDKRKVKRATAGHVKIRQRVYGRGETPTGRYLAATVGPVTIRLETDKSDYVRLLGRLRRGRYLVYAVDANGKRWQGSPIYATDKSGMARKAFRAVRFAYMSEYLANSKAIAKLFRARARKLGTDVNLIF